MDYVVYYKSKDYGKLSPSDYPANIPLLPSLPLLRADSHLCYLPCPAKTDIVPRITDHIHFYV